MFSHYPIGWDYIKIISLDAIAMYCVYINIYMQIECFMLQ